jgi:hypothetical protein
MSYPISSDLQAAYDEAGETWLMPDGTPFTGIFRLLRSDEMDLAGVNRQALYGELRWQSAGQETVTPDALLTRSVDERVWQVIGEPEDDGFGEIIAKVRRTKRSRLGAQ